MFHKEQLLDVVGNRGFPGRLCELEIRPRTSQDQQPDNAAVARSTSGRLTATAAGVVLTRTYGHLGHLGVHGRLRVGWFAERFDGGQARKFGHERVQDSSGLARRL